jgi:hypothetical protein
MKFLLHKDIKEITNCKSGTFGFARHKSQGFVKPKETLFANALTVTK